MSNMTFQCGVCGTRIAVDSKHAGGKGKCLKCGEVVRVPDLDNPRVTIDKGRDFVAPTEAQLDYADGLGIAVHDGMDRREVTKLISKAVAERKEVEVKDPRLSKATTEQIISAFESCGRTAILLDFGIDSLDDVLEPTEDMQMNISWGDGIDQKDVPRVLTVASAFLAVRS